MADEPVSERTTTVGLRPDDLADVLGDHDRVAEALHQAFRWSDRTSALETAAFRIAELLNCEFSWPDYLSTTGSTTGAEEVNDEAIVAFVEQWVIDVATMSERTLSAARDHLGADGLMDFIHSLLVIEQRIRLDVAWQRLGLLPVASDDSGAELTHLDHWGADLATSKASTSSSSPATNGAHRPGDARLSAALNEWQAAVVCLDDIDPITTELVRLRCANYHDCLT